MTEKSVRVKICGVTTAADAVFAVEHGADAVGLNFFPKSSRYLTPAAAADIIRALPAFACPVGVFVNEPLRRATAVAFQLGLRAIQTVDDVPQANEAFPFAYVPAFRVKAEADLNAIKSFCETANPSAVLIDSHVPGQMGGTGVTAPWHLLAGFDPGVPVILAGGLTPENVAEAIRVMRPWGVDVASGVESSPGVKDPGKVRAFLSAVRATS
jgi:phosphoribosylanthranilate isomerase